MEKKHTPHPVHDFKCGIFCGPVKNLDVVELLSTCEESGDDLEDLSDENPTNLTKAVELKLASLLLKLEHCFLVPSAAVNECLEDFQYLIGTACLPVTQKTIFKFLQHNSCRVDESVLRVGLCTFHFKSHSCCNRKQRPSINYLET